MSEGRWKGETAICIASGPSLTQEDCETAQASGHRIITSNNSWQMALQTSVIYASDYTWWKKYASGITIDAERWTNNRKASIDYKADLFRLASGYNSGLAAIHLAAWFGASRILLLGYDCQATNGQLHWHGKHIGLRNPDDIRFRYWQKQYRHTPHSLRNKIVNCSRSTAIKVFVRSTLEQALNTAPQLHSGAL